MSAIGAGAGSLTILIGAALRTLPLAQQTLGLEAEYLLRCAHNEDQRSVQAFLERRRPAFKGC